MPKALRPGERWSLDFLPDTFGASRRFRILAVISGEVTLSTDPAGVPLESGQTALLPAKLDAVSATAAGGGASLLEIFVGAS